MADKNYQEWKELLSKFSNHLISSNQDIAIIKDHGSNIIVDRLQPLREGEPRYLVTVEMDDTPTDTQVVYGFGNIFDYINYQLGIGQSMYDFVSGKTNKMPEKNLEGYRNGRV